MVLQIETECFYNYLAYSGQVYPLWAYGRVPKSYGSVRQRDITACLKELWPRAPKSYGSVHETRPKSYASVRQRVNRLAIHCSFIGKLPIYCTFIVKLTIQYTFIDKLTIRCTVIDKLAIHGNALHISWQVSNSLHPYCQVGMQFIKVGNSFHFLFFWKLAIHFIFIGRLAIHFTLIGKVAHFTFVWRSGLELQEMREWQWRFGCRQGGIEAWTYAHPETALSVWRSRVPFKELL